jgi:hypothetical protein
MTGKTENSISIKTRRRCELNCRCDTSRIGFRYTENRVTQIQSHLKNTSKISKSMRVLFVNTSSRHRVFRVCHDTCVSGNTIWQPTYYCLVIWESDAYSRGSVRYFRWQFLKLTIVASSHSRYHPSTKPPASPSPPPPAMMISE